MKTFGFVFCCLWSFAALASDQPRADHHGWQTSRKYEFSLRHGKGVPVCEAYLNRLRATDFPQPPYCDRPENDSIPGFQKLNRVPLTAEEITRLAGPIDMFIRERNVSHVKKMSEFRKQWRSKNGLPPYGNDSGEVARLEAIWLHDGYPPHYYRFDPPVDIDNDGKPDNVLIWQTTNVMCSSDMNGYPTRTATHLVILNDQGGIDTERMRRVLGHPAGNTLRYRDRKSGKPKTMQETGFRGIGDEFGVFAYQGTAYSDTFFLNGDWRNRGWGESWLTNTLAVLRHAQGKTERICEINWDDPDTPVTSGGQR